MKRPVTDKRLTFNFATYDDYLFEDQMVWYGDKSDTKKGCRHYARFIVKHLDYFANPAIFLKSQFVTMNFVNNYIKKLNSGYGTDTSVIDEVINNVKRLLEHRYQLDNKPIDGDIVKYFQEKSK